MSKSFYNFSKECKKLKCNHSNHITCAHPTQMAQKNGLQRVDFYEKPLIANFKKKIKAQFAKFLKENFKVQLNSKLSPNQQFFFLAIGIQLTKNQ